MAEFVQTMKDMRRMCDAYASNCDKCPLASYECAYTPKHRLYFTDKQVEAIVATWAAENPEPKYPTWAEWLLKVGAARRVPIGEPWPVELPDGSMMEPCYGIVVNENERIPAYIAEPLGIEPKER